MRYSLQSLTDMLTRAGVEEPREEAVQLLSHFIGISRATLLCERHATYEVPGLDDAIQKRLSRYPLQYILGQWDFFGLTFRVNSHCLIPRPDTEILVEQAIRLIPPGVPVADLCTGSGCIAVSLLSARRDLICAALELCPETLALAVENAATCGVGDRFVPVQADLLQGGVDDLSSAWELHTTARAERAEMPVRFGAILSNPPYICHAALDGLAPELAYEPRMALDGGEDGLCFYRAILTDYRSLLNDGGLLLLEIGYDQADDLRDLADRAGGWTDFNVIRDLGGRDRVVILRAAPQRQDTHTLK